jgi:hypothetical protein
MIKNKLIAFTLILAFSWKLVAMVYVQIDFIVNQQEITAKLCENKAKPKLQCNGKCHLKKQLAKIDNTEKKEDKKHHSNQSVKVEELFFNTLENSSSSFFTIEIKTKKTYTYLNLYHFQLNQNLKAPPQKNLV